MPRIEGWRTNLDAPVRDPRRIVSISPSNTEILHALGLSRRIVGVDRWSDYPPHVRDLPKVGSDLRADIDRVASLEPDLVVAGLHVPGMEENLPRFEAAGLRYVAVGGVGLDGVWQDMRVIGRVVGRADRADRVIGQARAQMAAIAERYGPLTDRPRVHWEWSARPHVAARRSWVTDMIRMAGGENAYADLDVESTLVPMQEAVARNPEVLVACWCGARKLPTTARVAARSGWEQTRAVRSGRVIVFAEDLFGRPGPRLALGLERLARTLHPEVEGAAT